MKKHSSESTLDKTKKIVQILFFLVLIFHKLLRIYTDYRLEFARRIRAYNKLLTDWIYYKFDAEKFEKALMRKRIKKIAIYGIGSIGELFYRTIEGSGIEVQCFIDKSTDDPEGVDGIPVVSTDYYTWDASVDAILVTPVYDIDEITKELKKNGVPAKKILSLEKVVG